MEIKIIDMDHLGNGIGKIDGKVVFVPKSIPGDICDITIVKNNKKYSVGKINKIIIPSEDREEVICPYYNECGGCNILDFNYSKQLSFKVNKVKNIFKKYLGVDINPEVIGSSKKYKYRNKITYHVDKTLGLVSEWDLVLDISNCLLVSDNVNKLFNKIKKSDYSNVKDLTIRELDNGLVLSINGNMDISKFISDCIQIYENDKCKYYKEDGYIILNGIKYIVSNKSFFQINTSNITNLYDEIIKYCKFSKNDRVVDLYAGVGSISLYISKYVKEVLAVEIVEDGIKDAKKNALINNITNVNFLCGYVSKLIDKIDTYDVLIVDPPRSGLDKHTISVINKMKVSKVIYVSCNPITLVRDLKLLDNYQMLNLSVVDMFPGTHHVESIVLLSLKKHHKVL